MKLFDNSYNKKASYEWKDFFQDVSILNAIVGEYDYDAIVSITKGGMYLSYHMAKTRGIKVIETVCCSKYQADNTANPEVTVLKHCSDLSKLGVKKILILDDLSDSGDTLRIVLDDVLQAVGNRCEVKTASLLVKDGTSYIPDFYVRNVPKHYRVDFFWEGQPDLFG